MNKKEMIKLLAKVKLAQIDFYSFCRILYPLIYNNNRVYLKTICDELQKFWFDDSRRVLCLSMPPRHGKTYTTNAFVLWLLGLDPNLRIATSSYNATYATESTKFLRDTIREQKLDNSIIYSDIFPLRIEQGSAKKNLFKIEGSKFNYSVISCSPNMVPMGRGINVEIYDDLYDSAMSALSNSYQEKVWSFYANSMLNRLEYCVDEKGNLTKRGKKQIFINTIWTSKDVIEKVKTMYKEDEIVVLKFNALQEDDTMLCEEILPRQDYESYKKTMDESIFYAMYQNEIIDVKDRLYNEFKTYDVKKQMFDEKDIDRTFAVCDPATTGSDSLSMIIGSTLKSDPNKIFIRDIYFENILEENIEEVLCTKLTEYNCNHIRIEDNGVGSLFPKMIKNELDKMGNNFTIVKSYHQTQQKDKKIFMNKRNVERFVYYPSNLDIRFPKFWKELVEMRTIEHNPHDDAADSLTELVLSAIKFKYIDIDIP